MNAVRCSRFIQWDSLCYTPRASCSTDRFFFYFNNSASVQIIMISGIPSSTVLFRKVSRFQLLPATILDVLYYLSLEECRRRLAKKNSWFFKWELLFLYCKLFSGFIFFDILIYVSKLKFKRVLLDCYHL